MSALDARRDRIILTPLSCSISTAGGCQGLSQPCQIPLRYGVMDMDIEVGRWASWDGLPLYGVMELVAPLTGLQFLLSMTLSSAYTILTRP